MPQVITTSLLLLLDKTNFTSQNRNHASKLSNIRFKEKAHNEFFLGVSSVHAVIDSKNWPTAWETTSVWQVTIACRFLKNYSTLFTTTNITSLRDILKVGFLTLSVLKVSFIQKYTTVLSFSIYRLFENSAQFFEPNVELSLVVYACRFFFGVL